MAQFWLQWFEGKCHVFLRPNASQTKQSRWRHLTYKVTPSSVKHIQPTVFVKLTNCVNRPHFNPGPLINWTILVSVFAHRPWLLIHTSRANCRLCPTVPLFMLYWTRVQKHCFLRPEVSSVFVRPWENIAPTRHQLDGPLIKHRIMSWILCPAHKSLSGFTPVWPIK